MAIDTNPNIHPANTYQASSGALSETSSTGDFVTIYGSATKTVAVTQIILSGIATTSAPTLFKIIKRSSAASGGTPASMTAVPLDSNSVAATAAVTSYTGTAPTPGSAVGTVLDAYVQLGTASVSVEQLVLNLPVPLILRGTAQGLAINLNSASIAGGSFAVAFQWYEF